MKFIMTDEGRLVPNGSNYDSEYFINDHLGNTRVVVKDNNGKAEVMQESHYYPFGMQMEGMSYSGLLSGVEANKYLYNGKELQDDLGLDWYDYDTRYYNPQLAVFHSVDMLAEKYYFQSPYAYAANNPITFVDYMGMGPTDWYKNKETGQLLWKSGTEKGGVKFNGNQYDWHASDGTVLGEGGRDLIIVPITSLINS